MTPHDATTLINKFAKVYLSPYAKELPEMDSARWIRLIMDTGLPYKEAGQILTEFVTLNPPRIKENGSAAGIMPDIYDLAEFIRDKTRPKLPPCPCCDNTRLVQLPDDKGVAECSCKKGTITDCKNISHCNSTETNTCPFGEEFFQENEKKWIDDREKDPRYKKGMSFLKGGKIKKMLADNERTEKMERAIDLPGVGAKDVLF